MAEYPAGVHASLGKFLEALVYDVPAVDPAAVVFRKLRNALGERLFKIAPEIRHVFVELFGGHLAVEVGILFGNVFYVAPDGRFQYLCELPFLATLGAFVEEPCGNAVRAVAPDERVPVDAHAPGFQKIDYGI